MWARFDFLIPSILLTIVGFLGTIFFFLKTDGENDKQVSFKVFLIYSFITILLFLLIGLTGLMSIEKPTKLYILLQVIFFVLGTVHSFTLYRLNSWTDKESFWHEFIFTLYIALLGGFVFLVAFMLFNKQGYALVFATSTIFFLLPFLIMKCFDFMLMIPDAVYPKWYYPSGNVQIELPDEMFDDANVVIVEFRMQQTGDENSDWVKSRSKLPMNVELSRFFPLFLESYNDRNPGHMIEFLDENKESYGWNFYIEPKSYQFRTYINPDVTVRENGIKENFVIVAERV